jgi:NADH-quinone oxidoreductase subunit N
MPSASEIFLLLPTIVLSVGAMVLLLSEAFLSEGASRRYQAWLAGVTALIALGFAAAQLANGQSASIFTDTARADTFQAFIACTVLVGLALSVPVSTGYLRRLEAERGEYYALLLFASAGMLLLAMASDLLMIFIALEIMSISTYVLTAYLRRGQKASEAAFKYFILGAFSSALYLYGAALAYGAVGSTKIAALAAPGAAHPSLVGPAIALIIAGFAFKVAAVPFNMWAPDVYEGAPTPVTGFMAVGVKAAAFAAFFRAVAVAFAGHPERWSGLVAVLAILTMVVGNLVALPQRNVKRMLAYSSIAHAGYALVGLAAASVAGARVAGGQGLLFYLAAYTVTALGAFGIAAVVERRDPDAANAWDLERFAGLAKRRPMMALLMAAFMLSLAGIPPTAGFMGKVLVFRAALDAGQIALAVIGVVTSAIGAFYYLRVVVYMYFREPEPTVMAEERMPALEWGLAVACVLVFVLGIGPGRFMEWARLGAERLFF